MPLIAWDRKHFILLIFIILSCLTLIIFHLHGFSISPWRSFIDNSEPEELIYGQSQTIRSDDFFFYIPLNVSQVNHQPSFPVKNQLIGQGQNTLTMSVPVFHWVTIFRPQLWGYFLEAEVGMSWDWWFRVFGLFYSLFLVFMVISRNRFLISIFASLALLYSPFFQFWSLNQACLVIFANICFLSTVTLFFSKSKIKILSNSFLLAWAIVAFCLFIYPPSQITLIYLYPLLVLGFIFNELEKGRKVPNLSLKIWAMVVPILFSLVLVYLFYLEAKEVFSVVMETEYPGKRFVTGGGFKLWRLLSNNYIPWQQIEKWGPLGNICEAASFIFFFPLVGGLVIINYFQKKKINNYFNLLIILLISFFLLWGFLGFTPFLSKWTLLSKVPPNRALIGLGIANIALVVSYLSQPDLGLNKRNYLYYVLLFLWFGICIYGGLSLKGIFPSITIVRIVVFSTVLTGIGLLIIEKKGISIILIALLSLFSSFWFNPLIRGGLNYFSENPLSKKIIELDKKLGGNSLWLTYGDGSLSNLLKMLNIKVVNGVHYYPQFEIWKKLDPKGEFRKVYNRYAHVMFFSPEKRGEITFKSPSLDVLEVYVHPENPKFKNLGIDYLLLVNQDKSAFDLFGNLNWEYSFLDKHIYRVIY